MTSDQVELVTDGLVPAMFLCLVEGLVGVLDEFIEGLCRVAVESIAAGNGHISELLVVVSECMVAYLLDQTLGEHGKFLSQNFRKEDCKLITAIAADVDGDVEVTKHQVC